MNYSYLQKWVYNNFRINLDGYKREQLLRRMTALINKYNVNTIEELLEIFEMNSYEKQKFLDYLTINVTEFFRNSELFNNLKGEAIKEFGNKKGIIKIWSAACSNGAEPYSVAMMLNDTILKNKYEILATDIDMKILEFAKQGVYTNLDIKNISKMHFHKYFKSSNGKHSLSLDIKRNVKFKKHDLIRDNYDTGFDIILCRNVIIYFTSDVKERMYHNFSKSLKPGGLLFVGATESIHNYSEYGFKRCSAFIYKKV